MITVVGHTAIDHISRVPRFPKVNSSINITDRKVYFGGGAANIAAGIAVLGEKCTLLSAVGGDFPGSEYEKWLDRIGIRKQFFVVRDANTATAFMFTDEKGDQITFFEWGASVAFSTEEAPALPFVHMATADPEFNTKVAEKSEFSSFDPGQDLHRYSKEQLGTILDHIDILFANHHEIRGMEEILSLKESDIVSQVPLAIVTMGSGGSTLYRKGVAEKPVPAVPVSMADPTGAGDSYRAGFLSAFSRGYDPLIACRVGTVTASFVVEKTGCQTNLPTWEMMKERFRGAFGEFPEITGH